MPDAAISPLPTPFPDSWASRIHAVVDDAQSATLTWVMALDVDGDGTEEGLVTVFWPNPDDAEKRGHGTVVVVDDDVVLPLPSTFDINGVAEVVGALPHATGALVIVETTWMGGSGLHAFTVQNGTTVDVGEWACGT